MQIAAPCVVTLTWRLEDTKGELIDELDQPVEFYYGGDDLLAKVEEALAGQEAGFRTRLQLEPEHAFGDYDARLVFFEERSALPEGTDVGTQFEGPPEGATTPGLPPDAIYTVTEAYPTHLVLDGNHPLAGIALRLDVQVRDVREASAEERERGSVGEHPFSVLGAARSSDGGLDDEDDDRGTLH